VLLLCLLLLLPLLLLLLPALVAGPVSLLLGALF
jgi:hypothetical protein